MSTLFSDIGGSVVASSSFQSSPIPSFMELFAIDRISAALPAAISYVALSFAQRGLITPRSAHSCITMLSVAWTAAEAVSLKRTNASLVEALYGVQRVPFSTELAVESSATAQIKNNSVPNESNGTNRRERSTGNADLEDFIQSLKRGSVSRESASSSSSNVLSNAAADPVFLGGPRNAAPGDAPLDASGPPNDVGDSSALESAEGRASVSDRSSPTTSSTANSTTNSNRSLASHAALSKLQILGSVLSLVWFPRFKDRIDAFLLANLGFSSSSPAVKACSTISSLYELAVFWLQTRYMMGHSTFWNPLLALFRIRYVRMDSKTRRSTEQRLSTVRLIVFLGFVFFKVIQWWTVSMSRRGQQQRRDPPQTGAQTPFAIGTEDGGSAVDDDALEAVPKNPPFWSSRSAQTLRNKCCVCKQTPLVPCALRTSGFVGCSACLRKFVTESSACPVTHIPSTLDDVLRIYS
eukprot:ANDGO_04425.mRNA.1 Peroxisome assembly protein 12